MIYASSRTGWCRISQGGVKPLGLYMLWLIRPLYPRGENHTSLDILGRILPHSQKIGFWFELPDFDLSIQWPVRERIPVHTYIESRLEYRRAGDK